MADGEAELARVRRLVHAIVCRDRASIQLAQQRLEAYGVHRTAEAIEQDLQAQRCGSCGNRARGLAPRAEPEPVRPVIHRSFVSGYLTSMVGERG